MIANGKAPGQSGDVAVLVFSRIARDTRVLRQCALLAEMGRSPLVVAYAEPGDTIPYRLEHRRPPRPTFAHRLSTVARQGPSHLGLWAAKTGFWAASRHRWALETLLKARPGLVVANDWPALVVAMAYKAETNALVHYDTHEFATQEFDESAWWRAVYMPMVTLLEHDNIGQVDGISTIGPGMARALKDLYALPETPAVVRNIPGAISFDHTLPTAWPMRILYHGLVQPNRGLEALIDSCALWKEPHSLTIRGNGASGYIAGLKAKATATSRPDRIVFEEAVAPGDVMPVAARTADLGVCFAPYETPKSQFNLPNKLFEYIGSGLAVATTPSADFRGVIETYGVGFVSRDASAEAIAEAINDLTPSTVKHYRDRSREVAKTLCWENEREVLRNALQNLIQKT